MIIIDCKQNILFNRQKRLFLFEINVCELISKVDLILKLNSWAKWEKIDSFNKSIIYLFKFNFQN
jgi:hypothetical protein